MSGDESRCGCGSSESSCGSSVLREVSQTKATRRQFIKGVIASGAAMASATTLSGEAHAQAAGAVERLITLVVNALSRLLIWSMARGPKRPAAQTPAVPVGTGAVA